MDVSPSTEEDAVIDVGLNYQDDGHSERLQSQLIQFHKRDRFCDAKLVVGAHEVGVHRAVLAASSTFFFELFMRAEEEDRSQMIHKLKDVDWDGFNPLLNYMYTGKLTVGGDDVRAVYKEASRLRLDAASEACAVHLSASLTAENCLGIRTIAMEDTFRERVDQFIADNVIDVSNSKRFFGLNRIAVEVVGPDEDVISSCDEKIFDQVLNWVRAYMSNVKNSVDSLTEQVNVLYLNQNNTLSDCADVDDNALKQNEVVQDYKKMSKRKQSGQPKQASPEQNGATHFRKFNINPEVPIQEMEWSIIASYKTKDRTYMAIAMVNGTMTTMSVHYLAAVTSSSGTEDPDSPVHSGQPKFTDRLVSFTPIQNMSINRCAFGLKVLKGQLFACGGYDRGECIQSAEQYSFHDNTWQPVASMNSPRGRFSIAEYQDKIYACGGSSGQFEMKTVECYDCDADKWTFITNSPNAKASPGIAMADGNLYVIGGSMGQSTVTDCELYNLETDTWKSVAPLNIARFQVAVCIFRSKLYAVGGTNGWKCLNEMEIYDPQNNSWQFGPPLNICRRGAGISAHKNKIYLVGGNDGASALSSIEIYDADTRAWTLGPALSIPRANVGVATLGDCLFAVGGFSGKRFLDTVEYLDLLRCEEWCSYLPLEQTKMIATSSGEETETKTATKQGQSSAKCSSRVLIESQDGSRPAVATNQLSNGHC